ncbi:MAG: thiamine pyrophosphate-binding protein [Rhodospirillales bacterium]|nr:thiamine pyrophosphate-binding protein [Rhodospirillales bacterium]
MPEPTGHRKLLEQLRADGVEYMFGNPGSSEEGLLDEVARFPDLTYVLGLQEAALVCIADGYAQATHRPAVVQVHCSVGLGNAIGSLFHARQRRTPLLVIAGEAGIAAGPLEAHMSVDLVAMARPVTKYAARAEHPSSLLRLLRRCYKVAATPPFGPVFLSVPQDILDAPNTEPVVPTHVPSTRVLPEPSLVSAAAEMLRTAERPVIVMGDGVAHSGAAAELARLAEASGAGVYGAMAAEVNIGWDHPLYCGLTGHMFGRDSARTVADADAVLICGTYVFPDVFPMLETPFADDAKVIHVDLDAYAIGKNHPVTLGLVSDPKLTLGALADAVAAGASEADRQKAAERARQIGEANRERLARARAADEAQASAVPLRMATFAMELAKQLPEDAIVFDESLTHFPELLRWVVPKAPGSFFQSPGGTLGVAIPGAIGVKMAHPDRTVVGLTGDGGAMYTYQALWTAAHLGIGAKFVVCNNTSYRLLKFNLVDYWRERGLQPGEYPAEFPPPFDVHRPPIDFVTLARGLSVPAVRVETPEQIAPAIGQMLAADGPFLVEVILEREVPRGAA